VEGARTEVGAAALEGDAEKARPHLLDEAVGGEREIQEEGGFGGESVDLDAEGDVGAALAEEGADHHGLGGAVGGVRDAACDALGGGRGRGGRVLMRVLLAMGFGRWGLAVIDIISQGGTEAFLGSYGGAGGRAGGR